MKKSLLSLAIAIILILTVAIIPAGAYAPSEFTVNAEHCMLVNTDTNEILFRKNIDDKIYPASITKLLTALVVCENVKNYNETVTIDGDMLDSLLGTDSSLSYVSAGEVLTIDQMLHYLLITSGNDIALALANYIGGTVDGFTDMMNDTAKRLGMNSSNFINPHGLPDNNHYTTVSDIHKLAVAAFSVDIIKEICSSSRYTIAETNKSGERLIATTNFLIDRSTNYYYKYCTAGKTGYTESAGRCIVSTAEKEGVHYLCIVMKADPDYTDENGNSKRIEFSDTARLYEWAFNNFSYKTVIDKNQYISDLPVKLSWTDEYVQLLAGDNLTVLVPNEAEKNSIEIDLDFLEGKSVDAKIKQGEVLAIANVYYANEKIGAVELVAAKDIKRSLMQYGWLLFTRSMSTIWFKLIFAVIGTTLLSYWVIATVQINAINKKRRRARRHR